MAGLTTEGFTPLTFEEIKLRIESRLEQFSPGFDFSPESPDGQLIGIMSFEFSEAWQELGLVYDSGDPTIATGQALINIGQLTGIPFGVATRSYATISIIGTSGTTVPQGSLVSDADGNLFQTEFDAIIPSGVRAISQVSGNIPVTAGTLVNIVSPVTGWTSIDQPQDGVTGGLPQSEAQYRNFRNRTVLKNTIGIAEVIQSRLLILGVEQVTVLNNDTNAVLPDGTPVGAIHVTVGEVGAVTDAQVASVILNNNSLGCQTFGSTTESVDDSQGISHDVSFSKATGIEVFIDMDITFLDNDIAGQTDNIKTSLVTYINDLLAGQDVIWSFLFGLITPFGNAQVNTLTIGFSLGTLDVINLPIAVDEFAFTSTGNINITES